MKVEGVLSIKSRSGIKFMLWCDARGGEGAGEGVLPRLGLHALHKHGVRWHRIRQHGAKWTAQDISFTSFIKSSLWPMIGHYPFTGAGRWSVWWVTLVTVTGGRRADGRCGAQGQDVVHKSSSTVTLASGPTRGQLWRDTLWTRGMDTCDGHDIITLWLIQFAGWLP